MPKIPTTKLTASAARKAAEARYYELRSKPQRTLQESFELVALMLVIHSGYSRT